MKVIKCAICGEPINLYKNFGMMEIGKEGIRFFCKTCALIRISERMSELKVIGK